MSVGNQRVSKPSEFGVCSSSAIRRWTLGVERWAFSASELILLNFSFLAVSSANHVRCDETLIDRINKMRVASSI